MRLLLRLRPAVFHAHLTWPLACKLALISAIAARVPATIGTIHLYVDSSWTPWQRLQHHGITRGIGRYIAVSNGVAEKLRRELSVPLDKIRVVPNGVPLTMPPVGNGTRAVSPRRRLRAALGIHDAAPLVLIPGRLERQKGHCYALEAARSLPGVIFLLAGEGTERAPLEAQASRLGVGDRIRFLGHRQDLPDLLVACDIVCLPSLFEGLPLALLEAMVAGKPIVSTAIPGVDEAVVDGETGLLVPPADPHALESAIRRLMVDPNLAQNLGVAGRARAERFFSIGAMIEGVTRAYDELLAPERNSHGR
jgi:glycosyltransferase involved in cell wall biosynthesis